MKHDPSYANLGGFYIHSSCKVSDRFKCSLLLHVIITQYDSKRTITNAIQIKYALFVMADMMVVLSHLSTLLWVTIRSMSHLSDSAEKEKHKCFLYTCPN